MKGKWIQHLVAGLQILVGSTIMALAYTLFLIPHKVVPGGVGGIAMVLFYFFGTPVGLMIVALNVPLFVVGVRVLGRTYGIKSVLGMLLSSLMIDLFTYVVPTGSATDDTILACIFGGITLGAGLGLVFRGGGSTGGSDIVGAVLHRYSNLSIGSAILAVDVAIISLAGLAFGDFELVLYGYLNLYLATRMIDLVLEGISYTRAMFVISDKSVDIGHAINQRLGRGATLLHGAGAYSDAAKKVVLAVMSKREVIQARELIRQIDPGAFVIITDVYDVMGEGFRSRSGAAGKAG